MSVSTISSTAYTPPAPAGQSAPNLDQAVRPTPAQPSTSSPAPAPATAGQTTDIITLSKLAISRSLQESLAASSQSTATPPEQPTDNQTEKLIKPATEDRSTTQQNNPIAHIVEEYNLQGKLRVKFMDRKNNVVYQLPPEMVAKMEDMMMRPDKTTETTV